MASENDRSIIALNCDESTAALIRSAFRQSNLAVKLAEKNVFPSQSDFLKMALLSLFKLNPDEVYKLWESVSNKRFTESFEKILGGKKR